VRDAFVAVLGTPEGVVLFQLLDATRFTIALSLIAFAGGGLVAALVTFLRVQPVRAVSRGAAAYVWLFQSVPLLMLLFLTGLGVPRLLGMDVDVWVAAGVSLILYTSAYLSDVWRGAIEAVPEGQREAGRALGLPFGRILRLVVLPQAVRLAVAPTVGFMVQIIKGTSLAYIIGFHDLMTVGKRWANAPVAGTEPFVIYPLMALIYFVLSFPLTRYSRHLERRLGTASKEPMPMGT